MNESDLRDLLPPERRLPADRRMRMRSALAAQIAAGADAQAGPAPTAEATPPAPAPPPADRRPPVEGGHARRARRSRPRGRRARRNRFWLGAVAAGAAAASAVGVAAVARDGAGEQTTVRSAATTTDTTTTDTTVADPRPANGAAPGRAVAAGNVLRTYDEQGEETGTTSLDPLHSVTAITSDLTGGWVACGEEPDEDSPLLDQHEQPLDPPQYLDVTRLVWFPEGRDPVVLPTAIEPECRAEGVQVVDSPAGPTAVYRSRGYSQAEMEVIEPDVAANIGWHAITLETGTDTPLPFPRPTGPVWSARPPWAAATGRLLVQDTGGYHLYDLDTHETLPDPPLDVTPNAFRLSPDGTTVATVHATPDGVAELAVHDLATGARTFEQRIDIAGPILDLSYDGAVAAVASTADAETGFVTVVDLASGAVRTLDGHGAPA